MVDPRQQFHCVIVPWTGRRGSPDQPRPTAKNTVERDREAYLAGRFKATLGLQDCYGSIEPVITEIYTASKKQSLGKGVCC